MVIFLSHARTMNKLFLVYIFVDAPSCFEELPKQRGLSQSRQRRPPLHILYCSTPLVSLRAFWYCGGTVHHQT